HYYYAMSLWKGARGATATVDLKTIEKHLKRAASLDANLSKAFLQLGTLYGDQGRDAEAINALRRVIQLEPADAQAHYRLARAYQRAGQRALAAKELELFRKLKAK
ncbi:MAG: tetratricopeptide repeat protein, partial [Vicinamibacteraceae bacterium]